MRSMTLGDLRKFIEETKEKPDDLQVNIDIPYLFACEEDEVSHHCIGALNVKARTIKLDPQEDTETITIRAHDNDCHNAFEPCGYYLGDDD